MKKYFWMLSLISAPVLWSSCDKDEPENRPDLVIPTVYDGTNFTTNAATELAVRAQLAALTKEMQKGRTPGTILDFGVLNGLYTAGSPSLQAVVSTFYGAKLSGTGGWLDELAKASGNTFTPSATPSGNGGTYGAYLFEENGLELEQVIEKGQFGATLYKHAVDLLNAKIDVTTADKVLAIYGSNPSFPNTNTAKAAVPDVQAAVYAARRTDSSDANGLYFKIKNALIKLQAAAKAGDAYAKEQQEAAADIKLNWEKANAATIINYCYSSYATLSKTEPTDAELASALHAVSECVGFAKGWKTISSKKITDAQIEQIVTLLNAPSESTPTVYKFAVNRFDEVNKLLDIVSLLKDIYGFTPADLENFKINWVSTQGR